MFSIIQMPFLAPTLDNADSLFFLVITPGFYLNHRIEVADQDPASGSLRVYKLIGHYQRITIYYWFLLHVN